MKRKGLAPMESGHVNVTPLIDVIMCLIIFFLLCGQFAKEEASDRVRIPQADLGLQMTDQQGRLLINVVPPETSDAGTAPDIIIRSHSVSPERLTAYLLNEKENNPEVKVIIRADQDVAYNWISPVLAACAQANIKSVNFSTRNK
ncbi:MAG TPA: biopolymer transporter ExbD [Phycisphaerae bacterium]|jgi:biopolymer transport protein ExbD